MVVVGVDGFSRASEFRLATRIRQKLMGMWEQPTLDWWSSKKLAQLDRYCCRGGEDGSIGDARTVALKGEFLWAVPPIPMIEYSLKRMLQAKAKGIIVVPLWRSAAYYAWRMQMKAEWVLPWSRDSPVIV